MYYFHNRSVTGKLNLDTQLLNDKYCASNSPRASGCVKKHKVKNRIGEVTNVVLFKDLHVEEGCPIKSSFPLACPKFPH